MKVLVTGSDGFIGKNLVKSLKRDNIEVVEYPLMGNMPDLDGVDKVVHLGAISSTTEKNVNMIMDHNYDFSYKLLMHCIDKQVDFAYASSASIYGSPITFDDVTRENFSADGTAGFSENQNASPQSPYAWSKYMFDRLVIKTISYNLPIAIQGFRYFNVFGPYEEHKGEQASVISKWTNNEKITLFKGSENFYRDMIHVSDVCDIHKMFFDVKESGIWNVGTGVAHSFTFIAAQLSNFTDIETEYVDFPEHLRSQYQCFTKADITKLMETLVNFDFKSPVDPEFWIKPKVRPNSTSFRTFQKL